MRFPDFDFSCLQDIPPIRRHYDNPRISITENGLFSMNGAFRKAVGSQRDFYVRISPDGRFLVLYPEAEPNVHFSLKGGCVNHPLFVQHLKQLGFSMPVVFEDMEWHEEERAWLGCCPEISQAPSLSELKQIKQTGRGERRSSVRRSV